jgi:polyisoprenoid-binding protein YceI
MARFEVDPQASAVAVAANSTVHAVHITAHGVTGVLEGELTQSGEVNLAQAHHAWLSLPVEALRSGNVVQDMEMDRRMDAAHHPTIDCEIDRLSRTGPGRYLAAGRLAVHGQTRAVEAEVSLSATAAGHVVIEVEHTFDMRDFGISPPRLLVLKMDPVVAVRVRIEADRES